MTTPNPMSVVEALEQAKFWLEKERDSRYATWGVAEALTLSEINKALPLARSMVEKLEHYDELVKYKEALEWMRDKFTHLFEIYLKEHADCPAIIRKMLSESGERT